MNKLLSIAVIAGIALSTQSFGEDGEKKREGDKGDRRAKMEERMKNMSEEERAEFKKRMEERRKKFESMSDEEKAEMKKKMMEMREKMKNMTPEERKEFMKKMHEQRGEGKKGKDGDSKKEGGVEPIRP